MIAQEIHKIVDRSDKKIIMNLIPKANRKHTNTVMTFICQEFYIADELLFHMIKLNGPINKICKAE